MAMMLSKAYAALIAAGAPPGKAQAASEEIADFERDISGIKRDLLVIKWMIALVIVVEIIPLLKGLL